MFAVVVSIFMVCWAPYHIYFIYSYHDPTITKIPYISHIYLAFYWLAMANTCVNPIIYYWMNKRFRAYFNMIFFFLPRYVSRAASTRWSLETREDSLARITRTRSCPATSRQTAPLSLVEGPRGCALIGWDHVVTRGFGKKCPLLGASLAFQIRAE